MFEAKKGLKHIDVLAFPFGTHGPLLLKGCFKLWCGVFFKRIFCLKMYLIEFFLEFFLYQHFKTIKSIKKTSI
jgi:hypothetical protein